MSHTPALLTETLYLLNPQEGDTVIDCTVGLGGHASALLERIGRKGKLIGLDADEENLQKASALLERGPEGAESRGLSTAALRQAQSSR